jgi:hypothetical protein
MCSFAHLSENPFVELPGNDSRVPTKPDVWDSIAPIAAFEVLPHPSFGDVETLRGLGRREQSHSTCQLFSAVFSIVSVWPHQHWLSTKPTISFYN